MCAAPATGHGLFWYSFDYAGIHVVQLSSEHNWTRGSAQFAWLAADLARVNRTATPWVIVTAHRMMVRQQTSSGLRLPTNPLAALLSRSLLLLSAQYTTQIVKDECTVHRIASHMREELEELLHASRVNLMLASGGSEEAIQCACVMGVHLRCV